MDSKRLRILKAMSEYLGSVTIANGYQHDIAGKIWRGRTTFGSSDTLPLISILEYPRPDFRNQVAGSESRKRVEDWDILIQGFVEDDKENPTDPAHNLLADVKLALGKLRVEASEDYLLGGLITDLDTDGGIVRPASDESEKAHFYLKLVLKFVERDDNPYAD